MKPQRTGFLGLSHLEIVSSAGLASLGNAVVAIDGDFKKVEQLLRFQPPIFEPGLGEALHASAGRMIFGTDPALLGESPVVILSQDMPVDDDNTAKLSIVQRLVEGVLEHLQRGS